MAAAAVTDHYSWDYDSFEEEGESLETNEKPPTRKVTRWSYYFEGDVEIPEICIHSLIQQCPDEEAVCKRLHCKRKWHWQFQKGFHWYNLSWLQSNRLERAYLNVETDQVVLYPLDLSRMGKLGSRLYSFLGNDCWRANFTYMKITNVSNDDSLKIRRLSTPAFEKFKNRYSTEFRWFCYDNNCWVELGQFWENKRKEAGKPFVMNSLVTSRDVERHFLKNPNVPMDVEIADKKFTLNVLTLKLIDWNSNETMLVRRRPNNDDLVSQTVWAHHPKGDVEVLEICRNTVDRKCAIPRGCGRLHADTDSHWQFVHDGVWYNFPTLQNRVIEQAFHKVKKRKQILPPICIERSGNIGREVSKFLGTTEWYLDFNTMNIHNRENPERTLGIRRLTVPLAANSQVEADSKCVWLYQTKEDSWVDFYSATDLQKFKLTPFSEIEKAYISNPEDTIVVKLQFGAFDLCFRSMKLKNLVTGEEILVRRNSSLSMATLKKENKKPEQNGTGIADSNLTVPLAANSQVEPASTYVWLYQTKEDSWVEFCSATDLQAFRLTLSSEIEKAYISNPEDTIVIKLQFGTFDLCFPSMKLKNLVTGEETPVRRNISFSKATSKNNNKKPKEPEQNDTRITDSSLTVPLAAYSQVEADSTYVWLYQTKEDSWVEFYSATDLQKFRKLKKKFKLTPLSEIESAYISNPEDTIVVKLLLGTFDLCFPSMKLKNHVTGEEISVCRKISFDRAASNKENKKPLKPKQNGKGIADSSLTVPLAANSQVEADTSYVWLYQTKEDSWVEFYSATDLQKFKKLKKFKLTPLSEIEKAYISNPENTIMVKLPIGTFDLCFPLMKMKNSVTGEEISVCRKISFSKAASKKENEKPKKPDQKYTRIADSSLKIPVLYDITVKEQQTVKSTLLCDISLPILTIKQIRNPRLKQKFECKHKDGRNIMTLFHWVPKDVADEVCRVNLKHEHQCPEVKALSQSYVIMYISPEFKHQSCSFSRSVRDHKLIAFKVYVAEGHAKNDNAKGKSHKATKYLMTNNIDYYPEYLMSV